MSAIPACSFPPSRSKSGTRRRVREVRSYLRSNDAVDNGDRRAEECPEYPGVSDPSQRRRLPLRSNRNRNWQKHNRNLKFEEIGEVRSRVNGPDPERLCNGLSREPMCPLSGIHRERRIQNGR